jgi:hypothetical protein
VQSQAAPPSLKGYAAVALADNVVTHDELVEAERITLDCLTARGYAVSYTAELSLKVEHSDRVDDATLDRDVDICGQDAAAPVIARYHAQSAPGEDVLRQQLMDCLKARGLIPDGATKTEIDKALSSPAGFACVPGLSGGSQTTVAP